VFVSSNATVEYCINTALLESQLAVPSYIDVPLPEGLSETITSKIEDLKGVQLQVPDDYRIFTGVEVKAILKNKIDEAVAPYKKQIDEMMKESEVK
jgi:hypothetical protein